MNNDFGEILNQLRDSPEQKELENRDVNARFRALGFALLFGFLAVLATASFFVNAQGWITVLLAVAGLFALTAWDQTNARSITLAKEQDRRYFLSCLRDARSIDDLNRAGLFAYFPATHGPDWVSQTKTAADRLRKALGVEPEWF